jgi:hypothetical protein
MTAFSRYAALIGMKSQEAHREISLICDGIHGGESTFRETLAA